VSPFASSLASAVGTATLAAAHGVS